MEAVDRGVFELFQALCAAVFQAADPALTDAAALAKAKKLLEKSS